jgi:hypothetical protein
MTRILKRIAGFLLSGAIQSEPLKTGPDIFLDMLI